MDDQTSTDFIPPPRPPPLLTTEQITTLALQGHIPFNLPPDLKETYDALFAAGKTFFAQPKDVKTAQYPQGQGFEMGYVNVDDEKEYVSLRHVSTQGQGDADVDRLAEDIWNRTAALLYRALCDLSRFIGVPTAAWDPVVDGTLAMPRAYKDISPSLMRVFRYEPDAGVAEQHRDLGLLTLCVGAGKGLQLWRIDQTLEGGGEWVDADGPCLMAGNTMHIMTRRRVASASHRVVANPQGRMSLVFAWRPCIKHTFSLEPFGGDKGEMCDMNEVWGMIRGSAWNVNAPKDVREKQREKRMLGQDTRDLDDEKKDERVFGKALRLLRSFGRSALPR